MDPIENLARMPLAEAFLEVQWNLNEVAPGVAEDPHYQILPGTLYGALKREFPFHERLPAADVPDQLTPFVVKQRFRAGELEWPLVQVGPGVITYNVTSSYSWDKFHEQARTILEALRESHPEGADLKLRSITLTFVNVIPLDRDASSLDFLSSQLRTTVQLSEDLFVPSAPRLNQEPVGVEVRSTHLTQALPGAVHIRFASGEQDGAPMFTWSIASQSLGDDVPASIDDAKLWLVEAHRLIEWVFFNSVSAELLDTFR